MEEKKENTQINSKEIKLLTFQPQQMLDEITKLKEALALALMENNSLNMFITDLKIENKRLMNISFKRLFQELLLRCLGGQWEEQKD
jgi:hypothetical protein